MLIYDHEIPALSVIPHLDSELADSFSVEHDHSCEILLELLKNLREAKKEVEQRYCAKFVSSLIDNSTDRPDRYRQQRPIELAIGDVVTVKQPLYKTYNYPAGIIQEIEHNDGEMVAVIIRKGNREVVRRHVSDVILIKHCQQELPSVVEAEEETSLSHRSKRYAAVKGGQATTALFDSG